MFHSLYAAVSLGFLSYLPSSMGKHIKLCPLGKGDEVLCAQHSLPPFPFPASRNTFHTDQVAFASPFKNSPNNVSCIDFTQFECTKNKNTKAPRRL